MVENYTEMANNNDNFEVNDHLKAVEDRSMELAYEASDRLYWHLNAVNTEFKGSGNTDIADYKKAVDKAFMQFFGDWMHDGEIPGFLDGGIEDAMKHDVFRTYLQKYGHSIVMDNIKDKKEFDGEVASSVQGTAKTYTRHNLLRTSSQEIRRYAEESTENMEIADSHIKARFQEEGMTGAANNTLHFEDRLAVHSKQGGLIDKLFDRYIA